jgi:class 3 adenylate cyclase
MLFRIGINLGDVIHDETRIYGDGINIAARLEALAEPGGALVSGTVFERHSTSPTSISPLRTPGGGRTQRRRPRSRSS